MTYIEYLLLFTSVIAGGGLALFIKKDSRSWLPMILSFSGAYVLGITVLHLMPSVFSTGESIGLWVLAGFFLQLLLEQLSRGVEHGHIHAAHGMKVSFAIQIMIGLCLHAFIEGIPLSGYQDFHNHVHGAEGSSHHFFYAILLHKIPAAVAMALVMLLSGFQKSVIGLCLVIFASMSPLGAFLGQFLELSPDSFHIALAIVLGTFLHIATTILFETDDSSHHHRIPWKRLGAIAVGTLIAVLTV